MTDEQAWADFRARREQVQTHPGMVARRRWDSLQRVHKVLIANQTDILEFINAFETNEKLALAVVQSPNQTGADDVFFDELFRRMHNYLSAVKMLVDHTRNLVRAYPGSSFSEQYRERVASLAAGGRGPFLQKLRDYLIHYRIPPFGASMHFTQESVTFTVSLNRDAALEFDDWSAAARGFLQDQQSEIALASLVQEYSAELEALYRWLYDQFQPLHGADIDAVNKLIVALQGAEHTPGHPDYRPFEPGLADAESE